MTENEFKLKFQDVSRLAVHSCHEFNYCKSQLSPKPSSKSYNKIVVSYQRPLGTPKDVVKWHVMDTICHADATAKCAMSESSRCKSFRAALEDKFLKSLLLM